MRRARRINDGEPLWVIDKMKLAIADTEGLKNWQSLMMVLRMPGIVVVVLLRNKACQKFPLYW